MMYNIMFRIPNGIFEQYYEVVDSLYENENIGDTTNLITSSRTQCPNCIHGATSVYKTGGPIPFQLGVCPYCGGSNYINSETTEVIKLRTYTDKRKWIKVGNADIPDGSVQILGRITDLTKVMQASYMIFFPLSDWKYKLDSDPFPYGFGKKNFIAYCIKV